MSALRSGLLVSVWMVCLVASSWAAPADGPMLSTPATKVTRAPRLAGVDFVAEFGGDLELVEGLGMSIDQARRFGDAPGLVAAALALHKVEEITGRKSPQVTSAALLGEAEEIATAGEDAAGLRIAAIAIRTVQPQESARAQALEQKAQIYEAERRVARRGGTCTLIVRNMTRFKIDIWVGDGYIGTLGPYDTRKTTVPSGPTRLKAFGRNDAFRWGPTWRKLGRTFAWTLNP